MRFVEAPRSERELSGITERLRGRVPLLANMVEGGATLISRAADLEQMGFDIVTFPGGIVRALAYAAQAYCGSLKSHGSNQPFANRMFNFNGLNEVIGIPEMLVLGQRYNGKS